MGIARNPLKLVGLDWQVPNFNTVSLYQKYLAILIEARLTKTGLYLLVDSTGSKMQDDGEGTTKKHGANYRREWCKLDLEIDSNTLEI